MPEDKKTEYNVTVLSRREISVYPSVGQEVKQLLVTYAAAQLPPNTLTFDKDKYTPENEKRLIRADIERRLKERPITFKV